MAKAKSSLKKPAAKTVPKVKKAAIPQAPPEHFFVLVDGRVLRDYKELADALEDMADHIYSHHVNTERNDFAHWVEDTLSDQELAQKMRDAADRHNMQIVIYRHILGKV